MVATAPIPMCWGSGLLRLASGGLLSPRIQPAFLEGGEDDEDDDDCPSDEEGRRAGVGGAYGRHGAYSDDEDEDGDDNVGHEGGKGNRNAAARRVNITVRPASPPPPSEGESHKASSPDSGAAATDGSGGGADNGAAGPDEGTAAAADRSSSEYVEFNASYEQQQHIREQERRQRGGVASELPQASELPEYLPGYTPSFVQSIYDTALNVCDDCTSGAFGGGEVGGAGAGAGTTPAHRGMGEMSETAQELYGMAATSFDTLATGLQNMMSLGSEAGSPTSSGTQLQRRSLPVQPHRPDTNTPPSYYSERDRLCEEAAHYEAIGDHAAALACLEQCLPPPHGISSGRYDLSMPSFGSDNGATNKQSSGEEYLRYAASIGVKEAEIVHKMGIVHWKAGSYEAALGRLLDALATYRRALKITPQATRTYPKCEAGGNSTTKLINPDADMMADILNSIGRVHFSRGDYAQAMRYYNESLALQTDLYAAAFAAMSRSTSPTEDAEPLSPGNDSTNVTHALASAKSFDSTGTNGADGPPSPPESPPASPASPISPTMSTGSRKRRKAAIMHPGVARTTICMGMVHEAQGRYSRAMRFYKDGLRAQRSALGSDHVDVAATLNAMGSLYEKTGDIQLSMKCFEEALDIYRSRLGDDHTDTAVTLNNVGQVQSQLGDYDSALASYSEAMRVMKKNLGEEHRNVAATMHNIGMVYSALGQYSDALKIYRAVLNSQRASLGDAHFDVAVTLDSVASAYEGQGRYDKAAKFYGKALRVRRAALGREHLFVGLTLDRLGGFHMNRDRNYSEAVRRFDEAKSVYDANSLDKNDQRVVDVLSKLDLALKLDAEARVAVDF